MPLTLGRRQNRESGLSGNFTLKVLSSLTFSIPANAHGRPAELCFQRPRLRASVRRPGEGRGQWALVLGP